MLFFKSLIASALLLALYANASPLPNAAFESYIKVKGSKQGQSIKRQVEPCETPECTGVALPGKGGCSIPEGGEYPQCGYPTPNRPYPQQRRDVVHPITQELVRRTGPFKMGGTTPVDSN